VIAIKLTGTRLEWNAEQTQFTNSAEANALLNSPAPAGWSLLAGINPWVESRSVNPANPVALAGLGLMAQ
jgi:hypothetical protein